MSNAEYVPTIEEITAKAVALYEDSPIDPTIFPKQAKFRLIFAKHVLKSEYVEPIGDSNGQ